MSIPALDKKMNVSSILVISRRLCFMDKCCDGPIIPFRIRRIDTIVERPFGVPER